jgi:hypothetical protein
MSIGKSGRIVIEVEPDIKQELYEVLGKEGKSLKAWFLENAQSYLADKGQGSLSLNQETQEEIENV